MTIGEVGSNVVANGSGAFNLCGLTALGNSFMLGAPKIVANNALLIMGTGNVTEFTGFTGPTSFGSGSLFFPNTSSGDAFGFTGLQTLMAVPLGYISGNALTDSATWNNATFARLGLTPGTYVWSWGAGPNQNFTLIIGGAGVPDGGSTASLLGCALIGLAALRRKLGC